MKQSSKLLCKIGNECEDSSLKTDMNSVINVKSMKKNMNSKGKILNESHLMNSENGSNCIENEQSLNGLHSMDQDGLNPCHLEHFQSSNSIDHMDSESMKRLMMEERRQSARLLLKKSDVPVSDLDSKPGVLWSTIKYVGLQDEKQKRKWEGSERTECKKQKTDQSNYQNGSFPLDTDDEMNTILAEAQTFKVSNHLGNKRNDKDNEQQIRKVRIGSTRNVNFCTEKRNGNSRHSNCENDQSKLNKIKMDGNRNRRENHVPLELKMLNRRSHFKFLRSGQRKGNNKSEGAKWREFMREGIQDNETTKKKKKISIKAPHNNLAVKQSLSECTSKEGMLGYFSKCLFEEAMIPQRNLIHQSYLNSYLEERQRIKHLIKDGEHIRQLEDIKSSLVYSFKKNPRFVYHGSRNRIVNYLVKCFNNYTMSLLLDVLYNCDGSNLQLGHQLPHTNQLKDSLENFIFQNSKPMASSRNLNRKIANPGASIFYRCFFITYLLENIKMKKLLKTDPPLINNISKYKRSSQIMMELKEIILTLRYSKIFTDLKEDISDIINKYFHYRQLTNYEYHESSITTYGSILSVSRLEEYLRIKIGKVIKLNPLKKINKCDGAYKNVQKNIDLLNMYGIPLRFSINKSSSLKENSLKLIWEIMCNKLPKPKGRFKKVTLAVTFCIFINNKMENLKEQQKVKVFCSAKKYLQIREHSVQNNNNNIIIINEDNLANVRYSQETDNLNKNGEPLELDHIAHEHSIEPSDEESMIPENVSKQNFKILTIDESGSTIQKDEFPLDLSFKNKCHDESRNCSVSPSLGFYLDREEEESMTPHESDKSESDTSTLTSNELNAATEKFYRVAENVKPNCKNQYEQTQSSKRKNTVTNVSCSLEETQVDDISNPLNIEPTLLKKYLTTNNLKDNKTNLDKTVEGSEIRRMMGTDEESDHFIEENETVSMYTHSKLKHKIPTEHINRHNFSNENCNERSINVESEEKASEECCKNSVDQLGENDVFINLTIDDSPSCGSNNRGIQDDVDQSDKGRQDLNIYEQGVHTKKPDTSLECVDTRKKGSKYKKTSRKAIHSHHSLEKICEIIHTVQEVKPSEKLENKIYKDNLQRNREHLFDTKFDETLIGSNTDSKSNQILKERECLNSSETNNVKVNMNGKDKMSIEAANRLDRNTEYTLKTQIPSSSQGHRSNQEINNENVALTSDKNKSSTDDSSELSDNRVSSSTVITQNARINSKKEVFKGPNRNTSKTDTTIVSKEDKTMDVLKILDYIRASLALSSGYEGLQGTVSETSSWLPDEESSTTLQSEHCNSTLPETLPQNVFHPLLDYSLNRFQGLTLNPNSTSNESSRQADLNSHPHIFPNYAVPSTSSGFERPGNSSASTGLSPHPLVDASNSASMHYASSLDNDRQSFSARDSIRFDLGRSRLIPYHQSSFAPPRGYYPCQANYPTPSPSHHGIHTNTYYPQPSDQYGFPSNTFNFFIDNRPAHAFYVPPNLSQPLFPSAHIQNTPQIPDPRTRHCLNIHPRSESQNNPQQHPDDYSINERSTNLNPPSIEEPIITPAQISAKRTLQQKIKQNKILFNPLNEASKSTEKSLEPDSQPDRNISSPEIREILYKFLDFESYRTQPIPQITNCFPNHNSIYSSTSPLTNLPHSEENYFFSQNYQEERNGPISIHSSHSSHEEYRPHIEGSIPSHQGEVETISDDSEVNDESSRYFLEQEEIDVEEYYEEDIQDINESISPMQSNPADIIIEAIASDRVYMKCIAALGQYLGLAHPYEEVSTIVTKIILQVRLGKLKGRDYFEIVPMMDLFISLSDRVSSVTTEAEKAVFLKYILPYSLLIFVTLTLNMEYGDVPYRAISLEMIATFLRYASGSPTLSPILSHILFLCFLAYQPIPTLLESGRVLCDHESYFCLIVKILYDLLVLIPEMYDPYRDMIIELMYEVAEAVRSEVLISSFTEHICLLLSPFMLLPIYRYYAEAIEDIINFLTQGSYRSYLH